MAFMYTTSTHRAPTCLFLQAPSGTTSQALRGRIIIRPYTPSHQPGVDSNIRRQRRACRAKDLSPSLKIRNLIDHADKSQGPKTGQDILPVFDSPGNPDIYYCIVGL